MFDRIGASGRCVDRKTDGGGRGGDGYSLKLDFKSQRAKKQSLL
jgi:hypothetical protein